MNEFDKMDAVERAFPSTFRSLSGQEQRHLYGMTLRDYFAAKAIQGLLAGSWKKDNAVPEPGAYAARAYVIADAMLEARK